MSRKLELAPIVLFGLAVTAPAIAQVTKGSAQEPAIVVTYKVRPSSDLIVRRVYIGDLDLKSASAQKEMEKRVNAAVEEMCAIPRPIPTQERNMTAPCREEAWESARPQMNSALKRATGS